MAKLLKNLPAMQETGVQSLGWEDLLEKGTATHSSILAWRIPWTPGVAKSQTQWSDFYFSEVRTEYLFSRNNCKQKHRNQVLQLMMVRKKEPNADTVGEEIKQNSLPYVTKIKRYNTNY